MEINSKQELAGYRVLCVQGLYRNVHERCCYGDAEKGKRQRCEYDFKFNRVRRSQARFSLICRGVILSISVCESENMLKA